MTEPIASRPPATAPVPHARDLFVPAYDGAPDTDDISFRELWDDPEKGITFADVLDIINPLQHIPIISTVYRMVTGDTISQGARMAGGILFGGVSGLLTAGVVMAFEEASGDTVENQIIALFNDDEPAAGQAEKQVATAAPATAAPRSVEAPPAPPAPASPAAPAQLFTARPRAGVTPIPAPIAAKTVDAPPPAPAEAPRKTAVPAVAAPTSAPEKAHAEPKAGVEQMAAERQRIAETLARARAQQTALLLASLAPSPSEFRMVGADEDDASPWKTMNRPAPATAAETTRSGSAFRAHPFMLPPGASSELIARAMEQALSKYHQGQRVRGAGGSK